MRGDCEESKKQVRGNSIMCGSTLKQGLELLTDMTKVNKKDLFRPNVTLVTWDILRMTNYHKMNCWPNFGWDSCIQQNDKTTDRLPADTSTFWLKWHSLNFVAQWNERGLWGIKKTSSWAQHHVRQYIKTRTRIVDRHDKSEQKKTFSDLTWDILRMTNYELLTEFWMGLMHRTERQNDRPTNQRTHRLFDSSGISL